MGFDSCEFVYKWIPDTNNPNKKDPVYIDVGFNGTAMHRNESSYTVDYNDINVGDEEVG